MAGRNRIIGLLAAVAAILVSVALIGTKTKHNVDGDPIAKHLDFVTTEAPQGNSNLQGSNQRSLVETNPSMPFCKEIGLIGYYLYEMTAKSINDKMCDMRIGFTGCKWVSKWSTKCKCCNNVCSGGRCYLARYDCSNMALFRETKNPQCKVYEEEEGKVEDGGGVMKNCIVTKHNGKSVWLCKYLEEPLSWVPTLHSHLDFYCPLRGVYPSTEPVGRSEGCTCEIHLQKSTDKFSPAMVCSSCTILKGDMDGKWNFFWDCSNILTGECVGVNENGCISTVPETQTAPSVQLVTPRDTTSCDTLLTALRFHLRTGRGCQCHLHCTVILAGFGIWIVLVSPISFADVIRYGTGRAFDLSRLTSSFWFEICSPFGPLWFWCVPLGILCAT